MGRRDLLARRIGPGLACLLAMTAQAEVREARSDAGGSPAVRTVYISGHSLIDRPVADDLARIAGSLGDPLDWVRRHGSGATLRQRACVHGDLPVTDASAGRAGGSGRAYDLLVATERHDLLGAYLWNDTIAQLAALHDCYTASNPHGASYFYVPWMSVDDRRDPRRWIAYEAAAAPHWRCIVAAANRMSRASRAGNRIRIVPAASALASLVAQAGDLGLRLDGARSDPAAAIALLFEDDVHPTRLASYVLALVTHAVIAGRSPIGAWAPEEIAPDLAARLQALADRVAAETAREPEPDLDACTATLRSAATEVLWPYMERAAFRRDRGLVGGRIEYLRQVVNWRWMLWRDPAWSPYPAAGPVPDARAAVSPGTALGRP